MSSWGASDSDESKPKWLTDAEKKLVFANSSGWVLEAGSALSGNDNISLYGYVTKSGTAQTDSEYDIARKNLLTYASFSNTGNVNENKLNFGNFGTGTSETHQGIFYLYNFNSASEYSFLVIDELHMMADPNNLYGTSGGAVHTVASASDGFSWVPASGNLTSGTFTLYKVV